MTLTTLSAYLDDFLAMKRVRAEVDARSDPERRQLRYTERLLRSFLEFWQARGCPSPIRAALALEWVAIGTQAHHPYRDQHRVWAIRAFLTQVRAFESATEIPPNIFRVGRRRRRPYLFSDEELGRLLQAPHQLRLFDAFRPLTLVTLMGLLASPGLRIGEALRLTLDDAKLEADPPHLLILDTKFGKSRVVVLHPGAAAANLLHGPPRRAEASQPPDDRQLSRYVSVALAIRPSGDGRRTGGVAHRFAGCRSNPRLPRQLGERPPHTIASRYLRLTAIRSFFRMVALREPAIVGLVPVSSPFG
jgi:integrase